MVWPYLLRQVEETSYEFQIASTNPNKKRNIERHVDFVHVRSFLRTRLPRQVEEAPSYGDGEDGNVVAQHRYT
jgi:hypothetical protein